MNLELAHTIIALSFWLIAGISVFSALVVIFSPNPAVSAVYLVLCFFALAGIYIILHAHFLAVIQILVYAGAVMVLFVMVIMLMNLRERDLAEEGGRIFRALGVAFVLSIVVLLATLFGNASIWKEKVINAQFGTTEAIARLLFTKYLLPFELTALLLLSAIVAVLVLARRWEEPK